MFKRQDALQPVPADATEEAKRHAAGIREVYILQFIKELPPELDKWVEKLAREMISLREQGYEGSKLSRDLAMEAVDHLTSTDKTVDGRAVIDAIVKKLDAIDKENDVQSNMAEHNDKSKAQRVGNRGLKAWLKQFIRRL